MYKSAANKDKTKEYADKLIGMKYKDVGIYLDMIKISLIDKDTQSLPPGQYFYKITVNDYKTYSKSFLVK